MQMVVATFNYSKLKGRIVEKVGTYQAFSEAMGWSLNTNGRKLSGRAAWTQEEIIKACEILDIDLTAVVEYFFALVC